MTIFVKLDLMMEFKIYQICSAFDYTTATFKILIYAGNKQFYQQVIHQQTKIWKVCASQNYRIRLSFRLFGTIASRNY